MIYSPLPNSSRSPHGFIFRQATDHGRQRCGLRGRAMVRHRGSRCWNLGGWLEDGLNGGCWGGMENFRICFLVYVLLMGFLEVKDWMGFKQDFYGGFREFLVILRDFMAMLWWCSRCLVAIQWDLYIYIWISHPSKAPLVTAKRFSLVQVQRVRVPLRSLSGRRFSSRTDACQTVDTAVELISRSISALCNPYRSIIYLTWPAQRASVQSFMPRELARDHTQGTQADQSRMNDGVSWRTPTQG